MRLLTSFSKRFCILAFAFIFLTSLGYMFGTLNMLELQEEKAKVSDKLNQAELELYEAERQIIHCDFELGHKMNALISGEKHKRIFVITPTYTRPTQLAELTVLAQALAHVPFLQWLVVEIAKTSLIKEFLSSTNLQFTHLDNGGVLEKDVNKCNVLRNTALEHLRENHGNSSGAILFANLDRLYSTELFEKIRDIKLIGIWPTMFAKEQFECNPLKFNQNMPKYAINLGSVGFSTALLQTGLTFPPRVTDTDAISLIIEGLISDKEEIETISCSQGLVWFLPIF